MPAAVNANESAIGKAKSVSHFRLPSLLRRSIGRVRRSHILRLRAVLRDRTGMQKV